MHNKVEKKQKMITENRQTVKMCTGDMAARITGLELCGELQYPNASTSASGPYFPFTGPTSLSVTLYKRDTLTSYKLLAKRVEVSAHFGNTDTQRGTQRHRHRQTDTQTHRDRQKDKHTDTQVDIHTHTHTHTHTQPAETDTRLSGALYIP